MFSTCSTACVGTLTLTKTDQCDVYQRSEVPVRLLLAKCDFDFPVGVYDDDALGTLIAQAIEDGNMSATPELADVAWQDPTTTTKQFKSRCRPMATIPVSRILTGKDYTATDVNSAGTASPYEDRLFFQNIVKNKGAVARGLITCDGKIYLFRNNNGTFAQYTSNYWYGYDTDVDGKNIEYKNYSLTFMGDPVNFILPYFDIVAAGSIDDLGWLFQ